MTNALRKAWEEVVRPLILRPRRVQVAALCVRRGEDGPEVLLVTSRDTGRWIVPKGWPIDGLDGAEAAAREAWEEAGVRPAGFSRKPVGTYKYDKILSNGVPEPILTNVYRIKVEGLAEDYPERDQRQRRWVPATEAAGLVREPELQDLLRGLQ
ncbi:NUDIX hydrolase [Ruegeria sp. HKCCD8929]|uniref:NUDIX hydrolase n=1 Tax=Ruegeria sp. HKCCD8929 TaxID=2683006 RepID=UPI00148906A5|nr:NUDIX hydrolase [Ruegeria sp. HKCCD8929]